MEQVRVSDGCHSGARDGMDEKWMVLGRDLGDGDVGEA